MKRPRAPIYRLSAELVSEYGGLVYCLAEQGIGKRYRLHLECPGPSLNVPHWRSQVVGPDGESQDVMPPPEMAPDVIVVTISGPIEQRAGYHDPCGGWSDGHDAIAERMIAALELADVVLIIDSPGGAHAGLQEAIRRVVEVRDKYNRSVTVYADELIGSAAYWWACCVGNGGIWGPESAMIGSIGARSGHASFAGQLEQDGIAVTYFTWPGEGKVAFAPELPLSDIGRQRGERDVAVAGEAFAKAVSKSRSLKLKQKETKVIALTRDQIVELDADCLYCKAAVKAGLADGIASLEDVMQWALDDAGAEDEETMGANTNPLNRVEDPEKNPDSPDKAKSRTEDPPEKKEPDPDADDDDDDDDDEEDRKAKKAKRASARRSESDDDDDDDDEEDRKTKNHPPPRMATTLAAILGLPADASVPAQKSAASAWVRLGKAVMSGTDTKSPAEALGALQAVFEEVATIGELRGELKQLKRTERSRERMALLDRLAAANLPGYSRGELFVDEEQADGKFLRVPSPMFKEMKLATLRGLVEQKTKNAAPQRSNPFEPTKPSGDAVVKATAKELENDPLIEEMQKTSPLSKEKLAASLAALRTSGAMQ